MKSKLVYIAAIVIVFFLTILFLRPSKVILDNVEYQKYFDMLEYISSEDRSVGTEFHDQMRDYLVEELEGRGLEVSLIESQEGEEVRHVNGEVIDLEVSNIYGYLPATNVTEDTKTIAFATHYDSVIESPGAADAGMPVVSIIAGLDQIINSERENNIVILITDHEELGLVGAKYIADYHPQIYDDIDFVYNWEARGSSGNVILFETSANDYEAIANYNKVVSQAFAPSAATAVYENMPNGSDFTVFKDSGVAGLNFAILEDFANYHTSLDTLENIPEETINTYINNVVELMVDSAENQFEIEATNKAIYFNYFDFAITIKDTFVMILIALAFILFVVTLIVMKKLNKLNIKHIIVSIATVAIFYFVISILLKVPVSLFENFAVFKPYQPEAAKIRYTLLYNDVYAIVMYIVVLITMIAIPKILEKYDLISKDGFVAGMMLLMLIVEVLLHNFLYGALQVVVIPLVIYQITYLLNSYFKTRLFDLLLIIILIPLLYPITYYIYIALTVNTYSLVLILAAVFSLFFIHIALKETNESLNVE